MSTAPPRNLHILRINGIAQSFFMDKDAAMKEMVRTYMSGVSGASVESIEAQGDQGIFQRGVEVFLVGVEEYMTNANISNADVLQRPALLYPCLMMRKNNPTPGMSVGGSDQLVALGARDIDELVANFYTSEAGEGIHRPVRPSTRPPLRAI